MADVKLNITGDASGAVQAAQQTGAALEKTSQAVSKAADDTERYNEALRRMAMQDAVSRNQGALAQHSKATADATAEAERYNKALEEMAQRQAEASGQSAGAVKAQENALFMSGLAERRAALSDVSNAVKTLTAEEVQAASQTVQATDKTLASKRQLKDAIRGLQLEFPVLGRLAMLAINPITLTVAAVAGAFKLWQERVDGATDALAGLKLPDLTDDRIGKVNAMAEAWKSYGDALRKAAEAYDSVEQASQRAVKRFESDLELQKKLLESEKKLALAKLENNKANLAPGEYATMKAAIEDDYAAVEARLEDDTARKKLGEKGRLFGNLIIDARRKQTEASGIQIGSAEDDANTERELKAQADEAKADLKNRREWLGRLSEMQQPGWQGEKAGWKYAWPAFRRYGYDGPEDAKYIEELGIEQDLQVVKRYEEFQQRMPGRDAARARRADLITGADAAGAAAYTLQGNYLRIWRYSIGRTLLATR